MMILGKTKKICNDCEYLKIRDGKFVCTSQRAEREITNIMQKCEISNLHPVGCEYCRGELQLLKNVWLEENTNHPKDEADILLLCTLQDDTTYKRQIPYCPMCKRKFI